MPALFGVAGSARADVVVDDIVATILATLGDELGYRVAHAEVSCSDEIARAVRRHRPTLVFNLCESLAGDSRQEPFVPIVLEALGVAYTGSPGHALRTCLHKFEANECLRRSGVRVPETQRVLRGRELRPIAMPAIVKPDHEDGSVGIDATSVVSDLDAARARIDALGAELGGSAPSIVVQQYIEGREISVSFLGDPAPRPLPLGEISFASSVEGCPSILTYASKWEPTSIDYVTTRPVSAAVDPRSARRIIATARGAFVALGLRDYGRVDMRVDPAGDPWVIDVNPNCDLGEEGALMRAGRRAGLDRAAVLGTIVRGALGRAGQPTSTGRAPRSERAAVMSSCRASIGTSASDIAEP